MENIYLRCKVWPKELVAEAIALPLSKRVFLAQELWQSIDMNIPETGDQNGLRDAIRRDQEIIKITPPLPKPA